jgi:gluconolactonase
MGMRVLAEGLDFPEGPVALASGSVLLVEIFAGTMRASPPTEPRRSLRGPGADRTRRDRPRREVYLCNNGGFRWHVEGTHPRPILQADDYSGGRIERIDLQTGAVECLYRAAGEVPLKGPNKFVFDAEGGFYFTDLGKMRAREMDRGAACYAKADRSLITEVSNLGPCLTADP